METFFKMKIDVYLPLMFLSVLAVAAEDLNHCPPIVHRLNQFVNSHGDYCYVFVNEEKYWTTARDYCWNNGGEMLEVDDKATMQFIRSTLNSRELGWRNNGVWLGAHDRHKEGQWLWSSNRRMSYNDWARGQPSSFIPGTGISFEDCACMRKSDNWKWHDCPCEMLGWQYKFICQFPFNKGSAIEYHSGALDPNDSNKGTVIGICVGSMCFLLLLLCILFFVYRRRQRKKPNREDEPPQFENLSYAQLRQTDAEGRDPGAMCFTANQMNSLYEEVSKPVNHGVNYYSNISVAGACADAALSPKVTNIVAAKENNATVEKAVDKPLQVKIVSNKLYDMEDTAEGATAAEVDTAVCEKEEEDHHYEDLN
ncbi:C-type mannose receptor 2-like isoform X2 [Liolophura sinensis]|uniref:C-type mannose receptor 2-like isoform X2 n=1 Tax=Liolophura sinensis TaxID=3198878 RepID=UPI0031585E1A